MERQYRIMVIDDEADLCEILKFNLEAEGYAVSIAGSAEDALRQGVEGQDLLLVDVMMGGMSGFALARKLKDSPRTAGIPVVFMTARDTENDIVTGFSLGADDYISKPFSIREAMARVKAILKRTSAAAGTDGNAGTLSCEGLVIDDTRKEVSVDGQTVAFTKTEYALLRQLLRRKGQILSRQQLVMSAWPENSIVANRTVDVVVTRVRHKIGRYADKIVTRIGFGYGFEA